VASVRVVVGHAAEAIEAVLSARAKHLGVVRNPEFRRAQQLVVRPARPARLPDDGPAWSSTRLMAIPTRRRLPASAAGGDADGLLAVASSACSRRVR
jgi:hypothetical protein